MKTRVARAILSGTITSCPWELYKLLYCRRDISDEEALDDLVTWARRSGVVVGMQTTRMVGPGVDVLAYRIHFAVPKNNGAAH